jgi:hypothetical protein
MPSPVSFLFIHPKRIPPTAIFLIFYSKPLQVLVFLGNFDFKDSHVKMALYLSDRASLINK